MKDISQRTQPQSFWDERVERRIFALESFPRKVSHMNGGNEVEDCHLVRWKLKACHLNAAHFMLIFKRSFPPPHDVGVSAMHSNKPMDQFFNQRVVNWTGSMIWLKTCDACLNPFHSTFPIWGKCRWNPTKILDLHTKNPWNRLRFQRLQRFPQLVETNVWEWWTHLPCDKGVQNVV